MSDKYEDGLYSHCLFIAIEIIKDFRKLDFFNPKFTKLSVIPSHKRIEISVYDAFTVYEMLRYGSNGWKNEDWKVNSHISESIDKILESGVAFQKQFNDLTTKYKNDLNDFVHSNNEYRVIGVLRTLASLNSYVLDAKGSTSNKRSAEDIEKDLLDLKSNLNKFNIYFNDISNSAYNEEKTICNNFKNQVLDIHYKYMITHDSEMFKIKNHHEDFFISLQESILRKYKELLKTIDQYENMIIDELKNYNSPIINKKLGKLEPKVSIEKNIGKASSSSKEDIKNHISDLVDGGDGITGITVGRLTDMVASKLAKIFPHNNKDDFLNQYISDYSNEFKEFIKETLDKEHEQKWKKYIKFINMFVISFNPATLFVNSSLMAVMQFYKNKYYTPKPNYLLTLDNFKMFQTNNSSIDILEKFIYLTDRNSFHGIRLNDGLETKLYNLDDILKNPIGDNLRFSLENEFAKSFEDDFRKKYGV